MPPSGRVQEVLEVVRVASHNPRSIRSFVRIRCRRGANTVYMGFDVIQLLLGVREEKPAGVTEKITIPRLKERVLVIRHSASCDNGA